MLSGGSEPGTELHGSVGLPHHSCRDAEPAQLPLEGSLHRGGAHLHRLWVPLWESPTGTGDPHTIILLLKSFEVGMSSICPAPLNLCVDLVAIMLAVGIAIGVRLGHADSWHLLVVSLSF